VRIIFKKAIFSAAEGNKTNQNYKAFMWGWNLGFSLALNYGIYSTSIEGYDA
jgi:hypothetical protein